ncbi:hypothetical protein [Agreia sp. COWG]|uniref:hypothetical protein n=1 Tax=Agreia sp. COWG TaxID=2773266 RepID=UPI00192703F0|nr:hypothetical protein [Agreia sp. COWG]CAD5991326.1 conserved protein of unknown function [Agreia sp. COWG]
MTKKITTALAELIKALGKHAEIAATPDASVSKTERATLRVQKAATAYLSSLPAKKRMVNPFLGVVDDRIDDDLRAALESERAAAKGDKKKS